VRRREVEKRSARLRVAAIDSKIADPRLRVAAIDSKIADPRLRVAPIDFEIASGVKRPLQVDLKIDLADKWIDQSILRSLLVVTDPSEPIPETTPAMRAAQERW
jgi:hypothetical protein